MIGRLFVRLVVRLVAGLALLGLVAGVPFMLATLIGWPLPSDLPSWDEAVVVLSSPPTERLVMNTLAVIAWMTWVAMVWSLAGEVVAVARRGLADRRAQPLGRNPARLVAAVLFTAVATGSFAHTTTGAAATAAVELGRPSTVATTTATATAPTPTPAAAASLDTPPSPQPVDPSTLPGYRAALWEDPPPIPQAPGTVVLQVAGQQHDYQVGPEETLWDLAETLLGDPRRWPEIRHANPDLGGSGNGQVHILLPDDATVPATTLTTEAGGEDEVEEVAEQLVYEVKRGDWMWHLAGRYLGDEQRYPEIAALNPQYQDRYPDYPDHIQPGDELLLPPDARDHGQRPHATGTLHTPPEPAEPIEPVEPAEPPTTEPPPEPDPDQPPPATATPSPTPTPTTAPTPTGPPAEPSTSPDVSPAGEPPAAGDDVHDPDQPDGVILPSGTWISLGLAALIATAAAVLRLHRRRRARLSTRPIPLQVDPEPSPLPASLAAAEPASAGVLDYSRTGPLPAGLLPTPPTPAAAGVTGTGEPVSLLDWPQPVLAVHGDGATAVVRALLAAAVTTGVSEHPGAQPQVVIPTGLLTRLLPPDVLPEGLDPDGTSYDGERLEVVADPATAVLRREEEMVGRRRLLEATGAETVARLVDTGEHPEHLPPHLLLVDTDTAGPLLPRVVAVAAHRDTLDLHTVMLGHAEGIPGWHVAGDGTLTPDPDIDDATGVARLSMLDEDELADVLDVARRLVPRPESDTGPEPAGAALGTGVDAEIEVAPDGGETAAPAPPPAASDAQMVPAPSAGTRPPVRLCVLGPVGLITTTGPVTEGIRTGSLAVAALLAAHPHGRAMVDIAATLHPGEDPDAARNLVRTDTSALRKVLRRATGLDSRTKFVVHDERRRLYRLDPDLVEVDWWQVLAAIGRANTVEDDPTCLAALRQAVDGYTGDFADNLETTWTAAYATTIRGKIAQAWARIAEILEADQPDEAIAALEAAIGYEPVNEELVRRLLRIHGRHGHLDQVRTVMRQLEARLADLGSTEPSQETKAVAARQLARGHADADQPAGPAAAEPAMTASTS
ncbi:MAG: BTAD domain-containing putative transcriptional regulator [Natronosporangium sp.]